MAPEILTGSTVPVPPDRARTAAVSRRAPAPRRRPVRVLPDGLRPPRAIVRDTGSWTLQSVLQRHGLGPVAGVDEAGRGASAGPLVVASCVLRPADAKVLDGLTDSKLLTPAAREYWYGRIVQRALDRSVIVVPAAEVDRRGVHVANIEGMRRAVAALTSAPPGYVLTDGFPVRGFGRPALAVPKGDQVAACIAAASVLAKVTRDRLMTELDVEHGAYGFAVHKGYNTPEHEAALREHGPCPEHRFSFANVAATAGREAAMGLVHNEGVPEDAFGAAEEAAPDPWEPMEIVTGGAGR
ncbi:RNase HII [Pseudonocardia ammonioxydans]|uniref:Ribonuclease HII n=1 Tax=Pseudonocardia ammonioxydans TaxID=260086 RepID=A0A1I4T890_PSUAM|nr:RNase HII [Pseudonocardia ammonioxydans]